MADIKLTQQFPAAPDLSHGEDPADYDVWHRQQFSAAADLSHQRTIMPLDGEAPQGGGLAPFVTQILLALGLMSAPVLALGSVFTPPNLVIQSAAPPADTNVLRAPTFNPQKVRPDVVAFQQQNLLTSTLATAANKPTRVASFANVLQGKWQPSDTSYGQPITLQVVASAPTVSAAHFAPVKFFWQPSDTSSGTPKTLTQDAQLPFQTLAYTSPDRLRPVTDTSQKQPITLQVIVPPPPVVVPIHLAPVKVFWQPPDESAGTPKTLIQDAQLPVRNLFLAALDKRQWVVVNTSQGTPVELFPAVIPTSGEYAYTFIGV